MAEKNIELDSVEVAAAVFGNCDRNIRLLENEFSVTAVCRGTQLRLSGEPANVAAASRAVEGMLLLIENHTPLEDQTVRYCISLAHDGAEKRVKELTEDFVTVTVKGRPIRPKTLGQKEYLNAIRTNAITFGVGPAGTGKTYLAVAMAVKAFKAKDVSRIVLTRPAVEAGEKLGFLPGDLQQKVDPYLRPLYDGLFDMLGAETYERLVVQAVPCGTSHDAIYSQPRKALVGPHGSFGGSTELSVDANGRDAALVGAHEVEVELQLPHRCAGRAFAQHARVLAGAQAGRQQLVGDVVVHLV